MKCGALLACNALEEHPRFVANTVAVKIAWGMEENIEVSPTSVLNAAYRLADFLKGSMLQVCVTCVRWTRALC